MSRFIDYTLTADDAEAVNRRRDDFHNSEAAQSKAGFVGHVGNRVREGDVFPALIVRQWSHGLANLQVFLDGNDTFWAPSRKVDENVG